MLVLVLVLIHFSGLQLSAAITAGQQATALMAVDLRLAQAERALASSAAWYSMRLQAGEVVAGVGSTTEKAGDLNRVSLRQDMSQSWPMPSPIPSLMAPTVPPLLPEFLLQSSWHPVSCPAHLTAGFAEPEVTHCLQLQLTVRHIHHALERSLTVIYGWDEAEQLRFVWPLRA